MAEFSSPISSGIRVVRSSVPSSIFGGGPARAYTPPEVQNENSETNILLRSNQAALSTIASSIAGLQGRIGTLSGTLSGIAGQITAESFLEKQKELQQQEQERRLAEQGLREGKESVIEKKIRGALLFPVQKIAAKAQGTLVNLMSFFKILLGGWLINQGIETIKALTTGNKDKLEKIKNSVLKTLGIAGAIFVGINGGFAALLKIVTKLTTKITGAVVNGLIINPLRKLANAITEPFKPKAPEPPKPAEGEVKAGEGKAGEFKGGGGFLEGAGKLATNIFRGVNAFDIGKDVLSGNYKGAAKTGLQWGAAEGTTALVDIASILGAPETGGASLLGLAGSAALGTGAYVGTGVLFDKFFGSPDEKQKANVQPTTSKTPTGTETTKTLDTNKPAQYGEITAPVDNAPSQAAEVTPDSSGNYSSVFAPQAQIQPISTQQTQQKVQSVGPLPEPSPNVVMAPAVQPQAPLGPSPAASGQANDVPAISSSNPDNFYVMYSQLQYNVVM